MAHRGQFTNGGRIGACIEILEQPTQEPIRFRYKCENRAAAPVPGRKSTKGLKTYPTIRIKGYIGPVSVIVSCVTEDLLQAHPHKIIDKQGKGKHGVFSLKTEVKDENNRIDFDQLGVQCVKKIDALKSLEERQKANVDPFRKGFSHMERICDIDLHTVRLAFQAVVNVEGNEKQVMLPSVATDPIIDKKLELTICNVSDVVSPATGGKKILIFCGKVERNDIEIQFFEKDRNGKLIWNATVPIDAKSVHHQFGIEFFTPPYRDARIDEPVKVYFQMAKRNAKALPSNSIEFEYHPVDLADHMKRKRRRIQERFHEPSEENAIGGQIDLSISNLPYSSMHHNFNIILPDTAPLYEAPPNTINSGMNIPLQNDNPIVPIKSQFGASHISNHNTDMNYRQFTPSAFNLDPNPTYNTRQSAFQSRNENIYMPHPNMYMHLDPMGIYNGSNFLDDNNENFNFNRQTIGNSGSVMHQQQQQNFFDPLPQIPSFDVIKSDLMNTNGFNNL